MSICVLKKTKPSPNPDLIISYLKVFDYQLEQDYITTLSIILLLGIYLKYRKYLHRNIPVILYLVYFKDIFRRNIILMLSINPNRTKDKPEIKNLISPSFFFYINAYTFFNLSYMTYLVIWFNFLQVITFCYYVKLVYNKFKKPGSWLWCWALILLYSPSSKSQRYNNK